MESETKLGQAESTRESTPVQAIIISSRDLSELRVGGIGILERWERGLDRLGAQTRTVSTEELTSVPTDTSGPILLIFGDWVMETDGHEAVLEKAPACETDQVLAFDAPGLGVAPVVCFGTDAWRIAHGLNAAGGAEELIAELDQLGSVRVTRVTLKSSYWTEITDERSARSATWGLLRRLQFRPGGLVAKYLNRPISIVISKLLVNTPVTANQTTWFAFLVGAVGIFFLFRGGYWDIVLCGALLQINSIIDGIDGELARLRLKTSEYGAFLDSVCDEILNSLLFVGIGCNLWQSGGWLGTGQVVYLYMGIFIGSMSFLYALVHWHCKWKHGLGFYWWFEAYKPRMQVQQSTSVFAYFKKLFWKETFLLVFFITTIFQVYEALLWLGLPTSLVAVVFFFIHFVIKRARW